MDSSPQLGKERLRHRHRGLQRLAFLVAAVSVGAWALTRVRRPLPGDAHAADGWALLGAFALFIALNTDHELALYDGGYEVRRWGGLWRRRYPLSALDAWAHGSVSTRTGPVPQLWLRFHDGTRLHLGATDHHFFQQLLFDLHQQHGEREVEPAVLSPLTRLRRLLRLAA